MLRRFILVLVVLALAAAGTVTARAQDSRSDAGRDRQQLLRLKAAQQRAMLQEPMRGRKERLERRREALRLQAQLRARARAQARRPGQRMKPIEGDRLERLRQAALAERQRKAAAAAMQSTGAALAPNRLVNNPLTDQYTSGQSEVSIALDGNHVVAAWNDGQGFFVGGSTQGYGWSNDGGVTWHDGGTLPTGGGITYWASDPVVTVNEKTHKFYYAGLADIGSTNNGVGVVEGSFVGAQDTLLWGTPTAAVTKPNSTVLCDKEWIAADSTTNRLHVVYSRFVINGGSLVTDHIDYMYATQGLGGAWTWSAPVQISASTDQGYVQGSRVGTGPAGEVYATWIAIGQGNNSYWGRDFLRMRKSTNGGSTFGAQVTPDSLFSNFGAGAPGFNRATGITFPGMTVDRTTAGTRGRVYLTWNESINFYFDNLGTLTYRLESESNNSAGAADLFTIGDAVHGQILASDVDYWKFTGTAGQSVVIYADTVGPSLDLQSEMLCTDGSSVLSYSENGAGGFTLHVFTLPQTGTYYVRASAWDGISTGAYTIETGVHVPVGGGGADRVRDHRDIVVKYSSDGVSWAGAPKMVNASPVGFDDYLPEVVVAGNGKPYIAWYDFHDAPIGVCLGTGGNTYLTRSDDGGVTWVAGSPVSDTTTVWGEVPSNIEPNMGDYIGLHSAPGSVVVGWADGRRGSPDVFMATVPIGYTATTVSLVGARATPTEVTVTWQASDTNGLAATVERRVSEGTWIALGSLSPDGSGRLVYHDTDVTAGTTYGYRLQISVDGGAAQIVGETTVVVPTGFALALEGARPNPSPGTVDVYFTLPDSRAAEVDLVDVTGRRVANARIQGIGPQHVDVTQGRRVRAGIYLIRLTHGAQTLTRRVVVVE